ncbi:MAG: HPr(Ser) kinase/phosphatase [Myxococcota bacterium]
MPSSDPSRLPPAVVSVRDVLLRGELPTIARLVTGHDGLDRVIDHPRIQKSGLVLVGHSKGIVPTRVQILGGTEVSYLEGLSPEERNHRVEGLFALGLSCVVVTRGVEPLAELKAHGTSTDTPLIASDKRSSATIAAIHRVLDDALAPSTTAHGVLVDVHGVGVLLLGPSGIGKSECALELVERGHRLIADDQVILTRRPSGDVEGRPPPLLRNHLEVRGLGIVDVQKLFGATAVRAQASVDLVVELTPYAVGEAYDRLGFDERSIELLGQSVPKVELPVSPGRDMGVILEVAARHQLLKLAGQHPSATIQERLSAQLDGGGDP